MIEYEILIREIDQGEFRAQVREFPDLTEFANTPEQAYRLMIDSIETTRERFGWDMPTPLEDVAK